MERGLVDKSTLVAIGDAIRGKNGETTTYLPSEMAPAIINLPTGGGNEPTDEELTFTGDMSYLFQQGKWSWLVNRYGNRITTKDITRMPGIFQYGHNPVIPFVFNGNGEGYLIDCSNAFANNYLQVFPTFYNFYPESCYRMFAGSAFAYLPENYSTMINISKSTDTNGMFMECKSLREAPYDFYKQIGVSGAYYSSSYFQRGFYDCNALDELIDLPNPYYTAEWYSNAFSEAFESCWHLKDITFAPTMINGEPNSPKWCNQAIDLSYNVGYSSGYWINGLPEEKRIYDDTTYQQFKNDADAFATKIEYSRYNHDSAVKTINSLPDTSAFVAIEGGTNTIKFKGEAGSKTDGGAINTLTEQEIAVATAKGWTVSLS